MERVRIGLVGLGNMGSQYGRLLLDGKVARAELAAVCHRDAERTAGFAPVRGIATYEEMIGSGAIDAVIIATPHYSHTPLGIAALERGLHVLVDKPISVHKADALRLLAAHEGTGLVFGAIFNVRTRPYWQKVRAMVQGGEIGPIRRVLWNATAYFRTEAYYEMAQWRGTWEGEGGGVLINQCPHMLDLMTWIFGMPARVRGFCHLGKYHNIQVEDDVTAYMEYESGATAVLITSTGEAPGAHRVEITGDLGRLVIEDHKITFQKNAVSMREFARTSPVAMESYPEVTELQVDAAAEARNYRDVIQNFVDAILDGVPLIAPAAEGLHSLELANAILYSSLEKMTVELPLDAEAYAARLGRLVAEAEA